MDRNLLRDHLASQSGSSLLDQRSLDPFGIAETPLVDNLFSITRPDTTATTKPAAVPSYLTMRTASTKPRGMLRHPVPPMQQPLNRSRGG
jgi:hypothetical protein